MVSLLTVKVLVIQCCACLPPERRVDNRVNASTLGGAGGGGGTTAKSSSLGTPLTPHAPRPPGSHKDITGLVQLYSCLKVLVGYFSYHQS